MDNENKLEDICFPVPQTFNLTPSKIDQLESNKQFTNHVFQQTVKTAFQIEIPYNFTCSYNPIEPYQLATEEQLNVVATMFQALQPKDAIEMALAQQFIIIHQQTLKSIKGGFQDRDIKKFELSHQVLEAIQKYRNKGSQQINVQYNHNQGQINNINVQKQAGNEPTIEVI